MKKLKEKFEDEALKTEVGIYQSLLTELSDRARVEEWKPCQ